MRLVHVGHRLGHALAEVAILHAVAQFPGFVLAGARAARHDRAADRAAGELDVRFDGRIAAGVEDLAGVNISDGGERHGAWDSGAGWPEKRAVH